MTIPRRRPAAFTLLEVMTALMVFVLLSLLFATSLPVSRKATRANGQHAEALSLAQHKIDQLRARGYGGLSYAELRATGIIDASPNASPYRFTGADAVADSLPGAVATLAVAAPSAAEVPVSAVRSGTAKVTVTIRWRRTTFESKTSEVSLTALVSQ